MILGSRETTNCFMMAIYRRFGRSRNVAVLQPSRRRWRAGLAQRVGTGEGVEGGAGVDDAGHGRKRRQIDGEEFRPGGVAGEADVRDGDGVAVAIAPG